MATTAKRAREGATKPKRPMSAYNYYFREKRKQTALEAEKSLVDDGDRIAQSTQSKKAALFSVVGRQVGEKWKNISESERQPYVEMANRDMKRYQGEMLDYQIGQARKRIIIIKSDEEVQENFIVGGKGVAHNKDFETLKDPPQKQEALRKLQSNERGISTGRSHSSTEFKTYPDSQRADQFQKQQKIEKERQCAFTTVCVANKLNHMDGKCSPVPTPCLVNSFNQLADVQLSILQQNRPPTTFLSHGQIRIENFKIDCSQRLDAETGAPSAVNFGNELQADAALVQGSCHGEDRAETYRHQNAHFTAGGNPGLLQPNFPILTLLSNFLSQQQGSQIAPQTNFSSSTSRDAETEASSTINLGNEFKIKADAALVQGSCHGEDRSDNSTHQNAFCTTAGNPGLQPNFPILTLLSQLISQQQGSQLGPQTNCLLSTSGLEKILQMLQEQQQIRAENDRLRSMLRRGELEMSRQQLRP